MSDYLPTDILIHILARLPPKSLLRFTTVCKSWHSLITSTELISLHLQTFRNHPPRKLVRRFCKDHTKEIYSVHFDGFGGSSFDEDFKIEFPFRSLTGYYFRVIGCCNGLLCLSDDLFGSSSSVVIWNPAIRRFISLPPPRVFRFGAEVFGNSTFVLGFGFDVRSDDYKVVMLCYDRKDVDNLIPPEVEIYTVRRGMWRSIVRTPPAYSIADHFWGQVFLNGCVHWVVYKMDGMSIRNLIMWFDMSEELFGEMALPECLSKDSLPTNICVGFVGESLGLYECDWKNGEVRCKTIWVMKVYGEVESWSKLWNVGQLDGGLGRALDVRENGDILMVQFSGDLVSYDPEMWTYVDLKIQGSQGSFFVERYRESLGLLIEGNIISGGGGSITTPDLHEKEMEEEEKKKEEREDRLRERERETAKERTRERKRERKRELARIRADEGEEEEIDDDDDNEVEEAEEEVDEDEDADVSEMWLQSVHLQFLNALLDES